MSATLSIPAKKAYEAYAAAAQAKPGSREAKARTVAQGFEGSFLHNMLESMVSGFGSEGPLGTGEAGGGAWRGFLLEEMSKGISKKGSIGIAPQVYREIIRLQEKSVS